MSMCTLAKHDRVLLRCTYSHVSTGRRGTGVHGSELTMRLKNPTLVRNHMSRRPPRGRGIINLQRKSKPQQSPATTQPLLENMIIDGRLYSPVVHPYSNQRASSPMTSLRSKWPNNSTAAKLVSTEFEKVGIQVPGWEMINNIQEILYNVSFSNGLLNKPLHNVTRKYQNFEFKVNKEFLPQVVDFLSAATLANPALSFDNASLRETFENRVEVSPFADAWEAATRMSHSTEFEQIACIVKKTREPTPRSLV